MLSPRRILESIVTWLLGCCNWLKFIEVFRRRKNQQMTKVQMFIHNRLTQHVSGIIIPIVRRTDCIKPRVVLAWMCWLRFCGVGKRVERTQCAQLVLTLRLLMSYIYGPPSKARNANAETVSFYLLHNVSTLNQCRKVSCVTFVCKHFAS